MAEKETDHPVAYNPQIYFPHLTVSRRSNDSRVGLIILDVYQKCVGLFGATT